MLFCAAPPLVLAIFSPMVATRANKTTYHPQRYHYYCITTTRTAIVVSLVYSQCSHYRWQSFVPTKSNTILPFHFQIQLLMTIVYVISVQVVSRMLSLNVQDPGSIPVNTRFFYTLASNKRVLPITNQIQRFRPSLILKQCFI